MKGAKPGQVSSLAAFLVTGMATGSFAADLPKRTVVPFVIDPFWASEEAPLTIGKASPSDWMEAQERAEAAWRGAQLAYLSFNFVCRKNVSECPVADELHCDVTTFGKPVHDAGKWKLVQGVTQTQECIGVAGLRRHQSSMHSSVRFDGPAFDIAGPISAFDTLPSGLIAP